MVARRTSYETVLSREAADVLLSANEIKRRKLILLLDQLAEDPFVVADEIIPDASGRELCCIRLGRWEVVYRPDHAVKELRIVDIQEI